LRFAPIHRGRPQQRPWWKNANKQTFKMPSSSDPNPLTFYRHFIWHCSIWGIFRHYTWHFIWHTFKNFIWRSAGHLMPYVTCIIYHISTCLSVRPSVPPSIELSI
jgi:hypothetical protein